MIKFTVFLKQKRSSHFTWGAGDIKHHLKEDAASLKVPASSDEHMNRREPPRRSAAHDAFMDHHYENLDHIHHEHMRYYKGDSYSTNHLLRHGKHTTLHPIEAMHDHIHNMDQVTSHQTTHDHTVYRAGVPGHKHEFPPGHEYTDHGYTGTSFRHSVAASHSENEHGKKTIHVIHVPKGTKAHYLNVDHSAGHTGEHELLLHRGTKFKVTHHSGDEHHDYIHSTVVGQHPKSMPRGVPGKAYSASGWAEHHMKDPGEHEHGVITTHHNNEAPHIKAAIAKKAKLDKSIAKSKEKA